MRQIWKLLFSLSRFYYLKKLLMKLLEDGDQRQNNSRNNTNPKFRVLNNSLDMQKGKFAKKMF